MEQLYQAFVIFFFVLLNGFFVAAEFAIIKVRLSQIEQSSNQNNLSARTAKRILNNLDSYLSACQVGITFASLALGWVGEPYIATFLEEEIFSKIGVQSPTLLHSISFGVAFSIITYLHIVLGEMAPKSVAIRLAEKTTLLIAVPLDIFYKMFKPFIGLLNHSALFFLKLFGVSSDSIKEAAHTNEELKYIFAKSAKSGQLSGRGAEIMENVLTLQHKTARQIMIPRTAVVLLSTTHTFIENLAVTQENRHTRYPLCDGDLDHIIGVVHIKDVLAATSRQDKDLRMTKLKRDVIFYPETIPLYTLLREFQSTKLHMAILIDEYGGTTGIVTFEDVLEELVGEIYDEFDQPVLPVRRVGRNEFIVEGLCPIHQCEEILQFQFPDHKMETIGGMVFDLVGHIPKVGFQQPFNGGGFIVEAIDGQRIAKVRLILQDAKADSLKQS